MTKRFGFTLAEVLITLGIIGVVAAMTMPTLMNSTQGAQYKAAYKKALSALSQAVTLNVALDEWNFADLTGTGNYTMQKLLSSRMNVVRTETTANDIKVDGQAYSAVGNTATGASAGEATLSIASTNTTLFFNDGIMFSYPTDAGAAAAGGTTTGCTALDTNGNMTAEFTKTAHAKCFGFVDVNGMKGPNKVVRCDSGTSGSSCKVTNPTDVYPVMYYDQSVLPATAAARAVLYGK